METEADDCRQLAGKFKRRLNVKTVETEEPEEFPGLLGAVVVPTLADAEAEFETRLKRRTLEDLVQVAAKEKTPKPKRPDLVTTRFGGASA